MGKEREKGVERTPEEIKAKNSPKFEGKHSSAQQRSSANTMKNKLKKTHTQTQLNRGKLETES